jgi:membrane associated rhomboid family serine protease
MIPLRDDVPSRTYPFVNIAIIVVNVLAFLLELTMGQDVQAFLMDVAVVPARYTGPDHVLSLPEVFLTSLNPALGLRVLIAMFLHAGWMHLIGNMLYLWIFGDNVEDRLGHLRYLFFYLFCGWVATYAHIWSDPASRLPSLGASGAIAGVLGAYIMLYPQARVVTLVPLGIFFPLVQIPAVFFLGVWFLQQFVAGAFSLGARTAQSGGVAWWAHIGGFAAGFLLVWILQKPDRRPPSRDSWWEQSYGGRRVRGW